MTGRHRRRLTSPAPAAAKHRPRPLSLVDAHTHIEHLISDESVAAHRHAGNYLALCGQRVLAASLTAREASRCRTCQTTAVS